jgi:DNA-binding transcriptional ArsR family regulator
VVDVEVELVVGASVVVTVTVVVGAAVVDVVLVVVTAVVEVASVDGMVVAGAVASAPSHAARSSRTATRTWFDLRLDPRMPRRSYGAGGHQSLNPAIDKLFCQWHTGPVRDVCVIDEPAAAEAALDPVRARLLEELASEPASAAGVAARLGLPRQKVNYHLNVLESHGLIELVEVRARGGLKERVLRATAACYVVSPLAIGANGARPEHISDRLSAGYLTTVAGRIVHEVGALATAAEAVGQRLPTFTIDTEIGFRSAEDRAAFADGLTEAVLELVSRFHHDDGRPYRLVVGAHPKPGEPPPIDRRSDDPSPRSTS